MNSSLAKAQLSTFSLKKIQENEQIFTVSTYNVTGLKLLISTFLTEHASKVQNITSSFKKFWNDLKC